MRLGVDSYSYHRLLGEVRPGERPSPRAPFAGGSWDVVCEARRLGLDVVSLETVFLPPAVALDAAGLGAAAGDGLEIVLAWGHPEGVAYGADAAALGDLGDWIDRTVELGAGLLRIVAAGPRLRRLTPARERVEGTARAFAVAAARAAEAGVELAVENHADLTAEELVAVLERVDNPALRVCLDTANALRVGDEPRAAAERLAPWVAMVHLKDCAGDPGRLQGPASVPYGEGVVPLDDVLAAVLAVRPDAPVCVELAQLDDPEADEIAWVERDVRWLREAAGRLSG